MKKYLLLILTFSLLSGPLMAQNIKKYNKWLNKAEKKYEKGKYEKAIKFTSKVKKKSKKKLGVENNFLAIASLREAKYVYALGKLKNFEMLVAQGLEISEKLKDDRPLEYAISNSEVAELMMNYGNYRKAEELLDIAIPIFEDQGLFDGKYKADTELNLAKIYIEQGFYKKAQTLLNKHKDFYAARLSKEETVIDPKSGKEKKQKVSRSEYELRQSDYATWITLKSNILRHQGKFDSADYAFLQGQEWINKNLGKRSKAYAEHMLNYGLLFQENGNITLPVSMYEDALKAANSSYGQTHPRTIEIHEVLIKGLINENSLKAAAGEFGVLENLIKKYYGKNSSYFANLATIAFESAIKADDIKKVESQATKVIVSMKVIPKFHPKRAELNSTLAFVASLDRKYQNSFNYINENLEIIEELYGKHTPRYGAEKLTYANYLIDFGDDFATAKSLYDEWFFGVINDQITNLHKDYVNYVTHLASLYESLDDYEKAGEMLDEALRATRVKFDNQDIEYGKNLDRIARLQIKIGQYEEAEDNLANAKRILEGFQDNQNVIHYIKVLETEARMFAIKGMYDEAEDNVKNAAKLKVKKASRSAEYDESEAAENIAWVYLKLGNYGKTEEILNTIIKNKQQTFGQNSSRLIMPYVDYGRLMLIRGDYAQTEQFARRAYDMASGVFGEKSTKVVPAMQLLGELYTAIGDYERAMDFFNRSIEITESRFGRRHFDVAILISQLALAKFYEDDGSNATEIEALLMESRNTVSSRFGALNPIYADILKDLAKVNIAYTKYDDAYSFLDQSEKIWKSKAGKRNNINAAEIHILRGDIFYMRRNFGDAESEYKKASKLYEKFFNDKHPEYVKTLSKLSKVYYMNDDQRKAKNTIEEALGNYTDYINNYFPALSEREKTKYWNTIRADYDFYNTMALVYGDRWGSMVEQMYDNALKTKALLLSSSIKIRERIMNSEDEELKLLYLTWLNKKENLAAAVAMSQEQLKEEGLDPASLAREVEFLEKELSQSSELFKTNNENREITWEQIQKALNPNEVAIEMVRFRYFDHILTDSVIYAVLTLKNERRAKPELLVLNNGKELESKYFNYYKNAIKFRVADTRSYENFWKPIEAAVGTSSTIYLSADGVYNQINLEAIPTGENEYVLDNSNIVLVSNTKDLFIRKTTTQVTNQELTARIFGDPKFYMASTQEYVGFFRSGGARIADLPGTALEVNELTELLTTNGWNVENFTRVEAEEDRVKMINSPKVFHVATHGFFTPEDQFQKDAGLFNVKDNTLNNPLMRTGLMFTGAGDLLVKTKYNYNQEPGILTAYEAMNLNLDKTELVVLSACETGVGEVQAGEGVYGLQRSFLVAGAKSLIMSLFKVSDEATQKLMVTFYEKWLESGNKREAFIEAKKEIRNEYKDPLYWGAFIMIGID